MRYLIIILFSLILCGLGYSADEKQYDFFRNQKTKIKNPFELRDPFKRQIQQGRDKKKKRFGGFVEGNVFSNLPSIEEVPLNKIKIVGVFLGKDRRAMAKVDEQTFILKEGMKLGADSALLKAILPGGIVLVEKITNVYDQDEYLETIIPVSVE